MKIFVKINPFWKAIWWIIVAVVMWNIGALVSYYIDILLNNKIKTIPAYYMIGFLMGIMVFCTLGILFCGIRELYILYRKSYPKRSKKQKSNQIKMTQEESNYEINKYKNNLKLNL